MAIYEIGADDLRAIPTTSFSTAKLGERADLQRLLRKRIDVIAPGVLVIAEEFRDWEDSRRRIDLLGVDADANLVVIELKRTEDGGHMELQALRYAAMVSTMTFERAVEVFTKHLSHVDPLKAADAESLLLKHLQWDEPIDDEFAQDVRIVLASADFGVELTTAVLWLNQRELDIRCIRMTPHLDGSRVLLDVQEVIPLPEATDYQVKQRQKQSAERASRKSDRDYSRYDLSIKGVTTNGMPKRRVALAVFKYLIEEKGVTPEEIMEVIEWRKTNLFRLTDGVVDSLTFIAKVKEESRLAGRAFDPIRFFCADDELIVHGGRTYAASTQWGGRAIEAMQKLLTVWPQHHFMITKSES